jgi:phosphodiesterase/alkaline phosphatase D-like protein/predicted esterase
MNGGPSTVRFHDFYLKADGQPESSEPDNTDEENADKDEAGNDPATATANANATENGGQENEADNAAGNNDGGERRGGRRERGPRNEWRVPLQGVYSVREMLSRRGDELLIRTVGFTSPNEWQVYDPAANRTRVRGTELDGASPADFRDIEVLREFAYSKDGTRIPMNIIRRKGTKRDGQTPTILTGYGGYGISQTPNFKFTQRVWFNHGGMVVVANLRGGGEYGEEWHQAGQLTNKQNVFDDFIACAEYLIRSNHTSSSKLAIEGGSNGGLLMGAALTQRPDLFRAVVSHVGIYDMLRVELDPNGEFNTTEFGSTKDPAQFSALHAYSPYHHVRDRTAYPAVLLLTGEHDGRVNPAHSRKMTARLQAANASRRPVLLRTSSSGHGLGTALDERVAQLVDVYSFLFDELGVEYSEVARGPWVGGVTSTNATAKAKLARPGQTARLALSTSQTLFWPRYIGPTKSETNHYNVVEFTLDRLKPNTQYYYAMEIDGRLDRVRRGQFHTFPEGPASFSFAYASCARTASTSDVFDAIRQNHPLFYMNIGDFHYLDLTNSNMGKFREAYDLVLTSPQQAELYRSTAFFYMWDDHDYGGNNANKKATSQEAVRLAYREYVPHYPLAAGEGDAPIYQTFNVGRAKFIVTDLRSERDAVTNKDDATKSMMGTKQKEWFKNELLEANGKYPLIFWISTVPWLGKIGTNYYRVTTNDWGYLHHTTLTNAPTTRTNRDGRSRGGGGGGGGGRGGPGGGRGGPPRGPDFGDQDHWSVFATERTEICDFIKANNIKGLAILHGDSHMLAADDGSNGDFATGGGGVRIPVMCGGPLDQSASLKGGPYSQGVYRMRSREGGFGFITVTDYGKELEVKYSGRNNQNEEKVSLRFVVPATAPGAGANSKIATNR